MILKTDDGRIEVREHDEDGMWTWIVAMTYPPDDTWRLPTADEQDAIWVHRHKIENIGEWFYWSADDIENLQPGYARGLYFGDGSIQFRQKHTRAHVRLVRTLPLERIDVADQVKQDIEDRIAKGVAEYGERLHTHNGRDALQDAYEEALDLAMYLKQALLEANE